MAQFHLGDVIEKARKKLGWNQTRLGKEASRFRLRPTDGAINKSTVSKVETDPYTSELGIVWRLVAAAKLTFGQIEQAIPAPFVTDRTLGTDSFDMAPLSDLPRHDARDTKPPKGGVYGPKVQGEGKGKGQVGPTVRRRVDGLHRRRRKARSGGS